MSDKKILSGTFRKSSLSDRYVSECSRKDLDQEAAQRSLTCVFNASYRVTIIRMVFCMVAERMYMKYTPCARLLIGTDNCC